jgi:glycosyltransferase involved in cell wall biosynthesis
MKKISLVLPIYNEQDTIPELYRRLTAALAQDFSDFLHEIIFVDDGSKDKSPLLLKKLSDTDPIVKSIIFSRNFGHHIAISAGLDYATGDYVVIMDSDLQDEPESIIALYNKLQEGYDVVYAQRLNKKFSWFKRFMSASFIYCMKKLMNEKIEINTTIFRIMTRQVVDQVVRLRERQRYLVGVIGWVGFRHTSVPVEHGIRKFGETKYSFFKQIKLACNAIFSFSEHPLRLITLLGFIFMFISFSLVGLILLRYFYQNVTVAGWTSLIAAILFMGGVQLLVLGIMGEYLGRLYAEIKGRPLYVVRDYFVGGISHEQQPFIIKNTSDGVVFRRIREH